MVRVVRVVRVVPGGPGRLGGRAQRSRPHGCDTKAARRTSRGVRHRVHACCREVDAAVAVGVDVEERPVRRVRRLGVFDVVGWR
jgi:hypothetical protein